jgi:hypothetical protein
VGGGSEGCERDDHGSGDGTVECGGDNFLASCRRAGGVHGSGARGGGFESGEADAMRRRKQAGHAMLELALSAGVMITCLAGTFQFGYTFYVYNQLVTAVGNGGRYAATRSYRAASSKDVEKGTQAIRNMVVYGDAQPGIGATPVIAKLKPDDVDVHWVLNPSGAPEAVDVGIHEYAVDAVFKKFLFTGRPGVEFPYVGKYAPSESEP